MLTLTLAQNGGILSRRCYSAKLLVISRVWGLICGVNYLSSAQLVLTAISAEVAVPSVVSAVVNVLNAKRRVRVDIMKRISGIDSLRLAFVV